MKCLLYYKLYDLFCLNVSHMPLCMTWDYNKVLLREVESIYFNVLLLNLSKRIVCSITKVKIIRSTVMVA